MFLSDADYAGQILPEIKTAIAADPTIWSGATLQAEEEITGYLRSRYDVASVFSQVGTARNPRIVLLMVDLVLYHCHSRVAPRNIPEIREIRYEQAIKWLESVMKGFILPSLPMLEDEVNGGSLSENRLGSNPKLNHSW